MALTNYERVKRWREKNRALYNLRRRNARKVGGEKSLGESVGIKTLAKSEIESGFESQHPSSIRDSDLPSVSDLRELIKQEETRTPEERPTMPVVKPLVYRNDYGAVITESAWAQLQEKKRVAQENGYEYDPQ